jgi:translocon-associated protein subunit delta
MKKKSCSIFLYFITSFIDDLVIANQIGFITEFKLKCKSEINSIPLFAEVNGNIYPVFRVKEEYQFSWTEDKSTAKTGSREVRLFDEEQFANYRKSQRAGETPTAKELAKIYVKYSGSYGSNIFFLSSESFVLLMSVFVAYLAFQNRMKLVS